MSELKSITKEDVWGTFDKDHKLISRGMIVAQGFPPMPQAELDELKEKLQVSDICPIWKDKLPYKSVTVICERGSEALKVMYWLEYVHGAGCISNRGVTDDDKYAIRSDYQCW